MCVCVCVCVREREREGERERVCVCVFNLYVVFFVCFLTGGGGGLFWLLFSLLFLRLF